MKPRPYQLEAKREAYKALRKHRSTLVVMPTGCGKTVTFASIIADAVAAGKRVLVVAHREELLDQAADKIKTLSGIEAAIEQGSRKESDGDSMVVIGCVFSMIRRLDRFHQDHFGLIVVDEAHRTLAQSYRTLLDYFAPTRYIGFTATPNRGDELALGQVYDSVAFDMTTADAVQQGWLVPFRFESIKLPSLDLSGVRKRSGDMATGDLGALMSEVAVLREAIEPSIRLAGDKQAIVFTVTVAHMIAVAETCRQIIEERSLSLVIATVDGSTPKAERAEIMRAFRAREINWLINVEVATEGFDAPAVEAVICLRPTLSTALFVQMLGRGGRPLPGVPDQATPETMAVELDKAMTDGRIAEPRGFLALAIDGVQRGDAAAARRLAIALSAKPECLILDFADNSDRHDLARGIDVLGGNFELPEQREAERLLAEGKAGSLLEALELARAQRAAKIAEVLAKAGDPFALFGVPVVKDRWGREPTPKQLRVVAQLGSPRRVDFREANDLLAELDRREREGLCLYAQAYLLARLGYPVAQLRDLGRRDAGALIQALAGQHWQRPRDWAVLAREAGVPSPG